MTGPSDNLEEDEFFNDEVFDSGILSGEEAFGSFDEL
jgi:hypothetical protein